MLWKKQVVKQYVKFGPVFIYFHICMKKYMRIYTNTYTLVYAEGKKIMVRRDGQTQPVDQIPPSACFCTGSFTRTRPHSFVYMLSVAAFTLQWWRWVALTQTQWPTESNMFTLSLCINSLHTLVLGEHTSNFPLVTSTWYHWKLAIFMLSFLTF